LEKNDIYYPQSQKFGSYIKWDDIRDEGMSVEDAITSINRLSNNHENDVIMIFDKKININNLSKNKIIPLNNFLGSIVDDKNYYIYKYIYIN
jgi:hypothetical protein